MLNTFIKELNNLTKTSRDVIKKYISFHPGMNRLKNILLIAILIRFILVVFSMNLTNIDLKAYQLVGELTLESRSVYPQFSPLYYPYFPLFLYFEAIAVYFNHYLLTISFWIKIVILFFDIGNIYLIYLLSNNSPLSRSIPPRRWYKKYKSDLLRGGITAAWLYAINPVILLVSFFHGQFDIIPLFFILLSIVILEKKGRMTEIISLISISIAITFKPWPILFIYPLFKKYQNKLLIPLIIVIPLLSVLFYSQLFSVSLVDIINPIKNYRGVFGFWGIGQIFYSLTGVSAPHQVRFLRIIFFIAFAIYCLFFNKVKNLYQQIVNLMLFFYVFTFAFSGQYFTWIVPFLISKNKYFWHFNIMATIYLLIIYSSWYLKSVEGLIPLISIITWMIVTYIYFTSLHLRR